MTSTSHADATLRTGDTRFAYRRTGTPGKAVVLLHGWPQTSLAWRRVVPLLTDRFDVVVPDLLGFGNSSKPLSGFDKKTIARRLRGLVAALGLRRIALIGHVAYAYAAQWRDKVSHLVCLESSLPGFGQEEAMDVVRGGSWQFRLQHGRRHLGSPGPRPRAPVRRACHLA